MSANKHFTDLLCTEDSIVCQQKSKQINNFFLFLNEAIICKVSPISYDYKGNLLKDNRTLPFIIMHIIYTILT